MYKFNIEGLNKQTLEDYGDGPMSIYRRVLDDSVNVTSIEKRFEQFSIVWLFKIERKNP